MWTKQGQRKEEEEEKVETIGAPGTAGSHVRSRVAMVCACAIESVSLTVALVKMSIQKTASLMNYVKVGVMIRSNLDERLSARACPERRLCLGQIL